MIFFETHIKFYTYGVHFEFCDGHIQDGVTRSTEHTMPDIGEHGRHDRSNSRIISQV